MRPNLRKSPFQAAEEDFNNMLFRCSVPYEATRTTDNIRMFGTYLSGNSMVDNDIHNRPTTVYLSCNKILDLYRRGVQVRVLEYVETKKIYNILQTYLLAWKEKLTTSFNIKLDDPDFFIKMDELASVVYDHAEPIFANDEVRNLFLARAKNITRYTGTNFFKDNVVNEIERKNGNKISRDGDDFVIGNSSLSEDTGEKKSGRVSLADHLKEILAARRG